MDGKVNVLVVVEDEPDMRVLIKIVLTQDSRIHVEGEAATAEQAIRLAEEKQPDLIVLDHSIDGPITGLEVAPLLRRASPHSKILLFTAFDMAAEARREPAIDDFLRKDDMPKLLRTVQRLLDLDTLPA